MRDGQGARSPDFICLGGHKCGTSWLWTICREHPEVCVTLPKELDFFTRHFDRGMEWYRSHWAVQHGVQGEVHPTYLYAAEVADRIAKTCREVRLFVLLRNPYRRAISHLLMDVMKAQGKTSEVKGDALRAAARSRPVYVERSCFHHALAPFRHRFGSDRIHVFHLEEIERAPFAFSQQFFGRLGVDTSFHPPSLETRVNQAQDRRFNHLVQRLVRIVRIVRRTRCGDRSLDWVYSHTDLRGRFCRAIKVDRGVPVLHFDEIFSSADADVIAEDVVRLQQDWGGVPSSWQERDYQR